MPFFVKKNGKGIMKENDNLVRSCQDTREQLRLRMGAESQGREPGRAEGQRPGCSPDTPIPGWACWAAPGQGVPLI